MAKKVKITNGQDKFLKSGMVLDKSNFRKLPTELVVSVLAGEGKTSKNIEIKPQYDKDGEPIVDTCGKVNVTGLPVNRVLNSLIQDYREKEIDREEFEESLDAIETFTFSVSKAYAENFKESVIDKFQGVVNEATLSTGHVIFKNIEITPVIAWATDRKDNKRGSFSAYQFTILEDDWEKIEVQVFDYEAQSR